MASRYPGLTIGMIRATFCENDILEALVPNRDQKWLPPAKRIKSEAPLCLALKEFSFIDNPLGTMRQLREIAEAECVSREGRLDFEDHHILDIGPYVVLGLMHRDMVPFLDGGRMELPVQKVIEAVHLRKPMRIKPFEGLRDHKDVWAFPLRERTPGQHTAIPSMAIGFSSAADGLVDTVNEWLGALPTAMKLKDKASSRLNKIATEILDNAQRHGNSANDEGNWQIAGFMARRTLPDQTESYDCHIAIVNPGIAISSNILNIMQEPIRSDLNEYIKCQSRCGLKRETLATIYAMQDCVSSAPGAGGLGMMEMVEMVAELGRTENSKKKPAITIISGGSCIRFHDRYCGFERESGLRRQMFNPDCSVENAPDPNYVFDMDCVFPGTIVTMRFSLDCDAQLRDINKTNDRS